MPASVGPPVMSSRTGPAPRISTYSVAPGTFAVLVSRPELIALMSLLLTGRCRARSSPLIHETARLKETHRRVDGQLSQLDAVRPQIGQLVPLQLPDGVPGQAVDERHRSWYCLGGKPCGAELQDLGFGRRGTHAQHHERMGGDPPVRCVQADDAGVGHGRMLE